MVLIEICSLFMIAALGGLYFYKLRFDVKANKGISNQPVRQMVNVFILLAAAFVLKSYLATLVDGHHTDVNCFVAWSDKIYEVGIGKFYYLKDYFSDYPPGYLAILYVTAAVRQLFGIEAFSTMGVYLIKLVPILCDLGAGFLIYKIARNKLSEMSSLFLTAIYVLNPAIVVNSSIWCQVDSVFTLFVLLTCYFCMQEKRWLAYLIFAVGILVKPQTIIFTPVLIFTIVDQVFLTDFKWKKVFTDLAFGVGSIGIMCLLAMPFGIEKVVSQYTETLGSYEYASVNAYNFWALLGQNWQEQTGTFLGISYRTFGSLAIFAAVGLGALVYYLLKKRNDKSRYFLSGAVVCCVMFLFSVRMHERYMYPALILILISYCISRKKELFFSFIGFSVVHFINVAHVLYYNLEYDTTGPEGVIIPVTAIATITIFVYFVYSILRKPVTDGETVSSNKTNSKKTITKAEREAALAKMKEEQGQLARAKEKMSRLDWVLLIGIMAVYSVFALYDLGNNHAPETKYSFTDEKDSIVLDLGESKDITSIYTYLGYYENRRFVVELGDDLNKMETIGYGRFVSVFHWEKLQIQSGTEGGKTSELDDYYDLAPTKNYRYIRLTAYDYASVDTKEKAVLYELYLLDSQGNQIVPVNASDYKTLFDEQEEYDPEHTFRSGTYFDEIYHARTAYEMTQNIYNYENTHPPLGKFIISIGIRIFGMNPFGWRIMGTLFGILMLPFIFLFAKRMFGKSWLSAVAMSLFAFDFMHFVQTRIATIDVYGTFFIIGMYYFMYRYLQMRYYNSDFKKRMIPLLLSGLFMGLGMASKWTAVYAGAGLGLVFAGAMILRYREYRYAKNYVTGGNKKLNPKGVSPIITILYGVTFVVPAFILVKMFQVVAGGDVSVGLMFLYTLVLIGIVLLAVLFIYMARNYKVEPDYVNVAANQYKNNLMKTLGCCVVFFLAIPGIIYVLAYVPFDDASGNGLFTQLIDNQKSMFDYHSKLVATHPYSSWWYEWPMMIRPVYYYCQTLANGLKEGISAFGNPLVWWVSIPSLVYMIYRVARYKDKTAMFLSVAFFVQYMPWIFVTRITFAYHYFPSVPFAVLMIAYIMKIYVGEKRERIKYCVGYALVAFLVFLMFYPVLSGQPISGSFVEQCLRWEGLRIGGELIIPFSWALVS